MGAGTETIKRVRGDVLGGRFRIDRHLGKGGMGSVLAATDLHSGRKVALKVMRSAVAAQPIAVERFKREAAVLGAIEHPAVVGVKEAGAFEDGTFYISLELLEGRTLKQRLTEDGPLAAPLMVPMVRGLCDALEAVHAAGIVHRDVKPSNIFLPEWSVMERASATGEAVMVKLVDFGVAKVLGEEGLTATGLTVGTARYMAPEQLAGLDVDGRADLYAVGVVIYEALTGTHPFMQKGPGQLHQSIISGEHQPLVEMAPGLHRAVAAVVEKAMARHAEDRYATAAELARAFADAVFGRLGRGGPDDEETLPERPAVKLEPREPGKWVPTRSEAPTVPEKRTPLAATVPQRVRSRVWIVVLAALVMVAVAIALVWGATGL